MFRAAKGQPEDFRQELCASLAWPQDFSGAAAVLA